MWALEHRGSLDARDYKIGGGGPDGLLPSCLKLGLRDFTLNDLGRRALLGDNRSAQHRRRQLAIGQALDALRLVPAF